MKFKGSELNEPQNTNQFPPQRIVRPPFTGEFQRVLPPIILELALIEDVTGPFCDEVKKEQYIAQLAVKLREPISQALRAGGFGEELQRLDEICRVSASETLVIRALNECYLDGELALKDIKQLPFYHTYKDYFEQTAEIVARTFAIAIAAAAAVQASPLDEE